MSVSRDDFSIAFRSALIQRGASQKFSVLSLIFLALIIFFLDVYGTKFTSPVRGFLNDVVYRISYLSSTPTRYFPIATSNISSFLNIREENKRLKETIEKYKSLELNVEYLSNQNQDLQKILETEYFNKNLNNIVLAKVLVDKNSPFLKSIIINKGTSTGILKGMPVTLNNYLVGRIVETNYLSSRVLLLNDLNSRIPVTLGEGAQAILSGSGLDKPILEYLPDDYLISEETNVFASGKDGIFSPGTPIGKTNMNGEVDLFVDPNQLSFVTVNLISQQKGNL